MAAAIACAAGAGLGSASADPAVSGFAWGGGLGIGIANGETRYYADQTLVLPLGDPLALQLDASTGFGSGALSYDLGAMLFTREPTVGHIGLTVNYVGYLTTNPNPDRIQVGVDGALYRDQFTLQGMAGVEFDGPRAPAGGTGTGLNIAGAVHYYVTPNWRVWGGLGHVSGLNMLVVGTEFDPGSVLQGTTRLVARATFSDQGSSFWLGGKWRIGGEPGSTLIDDDRHEYATMLYTGLLGFTPSGIRY